MEAFMDYVAYSFDPRVQEARLEDYDAEKTQRYLSPTAQAAAWQREDGDCEQLKQTYDILGRH
jgi:hypothetical protein